MIDFSIMDLFIFKLRSVKTQISKTIQRWKEKIS